VIGTLMNLFLSSFKTSEAQMPQAIVAMSNKMTKVSMYLPQDA
jgi:hypothetical protein